MIDVALAHAEAPEAAANPAPESVALVLRRLREESQRWVRRERPCLSTGVPWLDPLVGGGWALGKVSELVGPASSGSSAIAVATAVAATGRGELVAFLDVADALDPPSLAAVGVDLTRVLWVRPRNLEAAVRAAELLLEAGGFTVVVVDLGPGPGDTGQRAPRAPTLVSSAELTSAERGGLGEALAAGRVEGVAPGPSASRRRGPLALRLARAVERARSVGLVLAERPWVGAHAALTLRLGHATPCWRGGTVRWLDGLSLSLGPVPRVGGGDGAGRLVSGALPFPSSARKRGGGP